MVAHRGEDRADRRHEPAMLFCLPAAGTVVWRLADSLSEMRTPSGRCSKCDGSMDDGSIVDEGYGHYWVSTWHPGQPVKSIWT